MPLQPQRSRRAVQQWWPWNIRSDEAPTAAVRPARQYACGRFAGSYCEHGGACSFSLNSVRVFCLVTSPSVGIRSTVVIEPSCCRTSFPKHVKHQDARFGVQLHFSIACTAIAVMTCVRMHTAGLRR